MKSDFYIFSHLSITIRSFHIYSFGNLKKSDKKHGFQTIFAGFHFFLCTFNTHYKYNLKIITIYTTNVLH